MDAEPKPKPDLLWWKDFFRPLPIARVAADQSTEAAPPPDTEPVVTFCHSRSSP